MKQPIFSLVHSTARLPDGWKHAVYAWVEACDHIESVEYIIAIDAGREKEMPPMEPYYLMHGPNGAGWFRVVVNHRRRCAVDGWNCAAEHSNGKFIITVSDDYRPPKHWDTELLKFIPNLDGEYVLDVDNQDNSYPLLPFSFLTRAYYKRLGHLFYPEFVGMMADNDFTDVARGDGVVIDARALKFTHLHPHRGTAPDDEVYQWQQRPEAWEAGNRVYARRKSEREAMARR